VQRGQLREVARHRAAPEPDVDGALPGRGLALDLQRRDVDRRRQAVQRHVDERGDPARGGGPGGRGEALPLGAARLVEVHVRVDQPGQQHLVGGQDDLPGGGDGGGGREHGRDPLAVDDDRGRSHGGACGSVDDRPGGPDHRPHPRSR
jgi:hypothetical protein